MSSELKPVIAIINGPNLNLLGVREPEIYGTVPFDDYVISLRERYGQYIIAYNQSNHEGTIIDLLHHYGFGSKGIILNAGGYTHTSIAIADAIKAISAPVVEVHISNIYEREPFRHHSFMKGNCIDSIVGKGIDGYGEAIDRLTSDHL